MTPEQLSRFIASFVHELNNPLAAILGYSELLQRESDPQQMSRGIQTVREQALACRDLVHEVEACFVFPTFRPSLLSIEDILSAILVYEADRFSAAGIEVMTRVQGTVPAVNVDLQQVQKLFGKLLANSRDAFLGAEDVTPRVQVIVSASNGNVHFDVADNGRGITSEAAERAFDPAFTTKRTGKGLGLGLTCALAIAQKHGGDICFCKDAEWSTVVRVSFPVEVS